ncbi:dihydrolipoamide acetyltransferase family protein [Pseudonocardia sp. HH130630-07]|uniref:dihydrolipoamide acetyltransferase family protein n=1 Tax=Pseudonocardia sp. HH130630-07 TaxID=1690815 RepID=UPI000814FE54|nr:dihydrolipoamide acetyltransferase family protein [Pseudonocardia sp. HH130630-07]ANY06814.1 branched-chain alpha-keto acid dehydrogenase subunit E2 [Pseudonocardia sp. HH130630-07]
MRELFKLPDVGEGLTEAEVVTWRVAPGDTVKVNDVIVEIETAKAAVELPSPWTGTVGELLAEPGATIAVGTPIIAIDTAGGGAPAPEPGTGDSGDDRGAKIGEAGKDGRIATLVGYGPRQGAARRRPRRGVADGAPAPGGESAAGGAPAAGGEPAPVGAPAPGGAEGGSAGGGGRHETAGTTARSGPATAAGGSPADGPAGQGPTAGLVPLAPPPVRLLARELGVDLRSVTGTGQHGRITRDDVTSAASAETPVAAAPARPAAVGGAAPRAGAGDRREPIRGVRKATAAAMVTSAFTAPHVTEFLTVDVTEMMALRDRLRSSREFSGVKLTPLAFAARAACLAATRTPAANASWDERAGEIVYYERVHLGIAAATPRGLVVPKIRDADTLDLRRLAEALGELTETARAGRTAPADLVGGTFTITNVGVFDVDTGTPILNPGESAILALGSIKQAPWVVDGELAVRTVCQLALSFDHRVVDGAEGSRFLADVGALLADPGVAFTW